MSSSSGAVRTRPAVPPFAGGRPVASRIIKAAPPPRPFSAWYVPADADEAHPAPTGDAADLTALFFPMGAAVAVVEAPDVGPVLSAAPGDDWAWMPRPSRVVGTDPDLAVTEHGMPAADRQVAAAEVIEAVARRLRAGEILLAPDAALGSEAAVVASVLVALEGARH